MNLFSSVSEDKSEESEKGKKKKDMLNPNVIISSNEEMILQEMTPQLKVSKKENGIDWYIKKKRIIRSNSSTSSVICNEQEVVMVPNKENRRNEMEKEKEKEKEKKIAEKEREKSEYVQKINETKQTRKKKVLCSDDEIYQMGVKKEKEKNVKIKKLEDAIINKEEEKEEEKEKNIIHKRNDRSQKIEKLINKRNANTNSEILIRNQRNQLKEEMLQNIFHQNNNTNTNSNSSSNGSHSSIDERQVLWKRGKRKIGDVQNEKMKRKGTQKNTKRNEMGKGIKTGRGIKKGKGKRNIKSSIFDDDFISDEDVKVKICGLDRYFKNNLKKQKIQDDFYDILKNKKKEDVMESSYEETVGEDEDEEEEKEKGKEKGKEKEKEEEEEEEKEKEKEEDYLSKIVNQKRRLDCEEAEYAKYIISESAEKRSDQDDVLFLMERKQKESLLSRGDFCREPKDNKSKKEIYEIKEIKNNEKKLQSKKGYEGDKEDKGYEPFHKGQNLNSLSLIGKDINKNAFEKNENCKVLEKVSSATNYQQSVDFEKLQKRVNRKFNFLSIVEITKSKSDLESEESEKEKKEGEKKKKHKKKGKREKAEEDINFFSSDNDSCNSGKTLSRDSFFSDPSGSVDSTNAEEEGFNTLDVYEHYFVKGKNKEGQKKKNVEKLKDNTQEYADLCEILMGLIETDQGETKEVEKNKGRFQNKKEGLKRISNKVEETVKKEDSSSKKKELLKKNVLIYRTFKNINNEISRQNVLKGERFRDLVYDFIKNVNKNILVLDKEQSKKDEWRHYSSNETSEVESVLNFENKNENAQLKKAECLCLFCVESNKILSNDELNILVFKYIEVNKPSVTIIKAYFMNMYIFSAFLNFAVHKKNIILCHKEKNVKKLKNSSYYKFNKYVKKKYKIGKMVLFNGYSVTLTTLAIYIYGVNQLNKKEKFTVVWNFFKWNKIRKNYFETLKLKKNKNGTLSSSCSFLIESVDKYCRLKNINIGEITENKKMSKLEQRFTNQTGSNKNYNNNVGYRNSQYKGKSGVSVDNVKLEQLEKALSMNLKNSNLQFLLLDPLYAACGDSFQLFPSHTTILF